MEFATGKLLRWTRMAMAVGIAAALAACGGGGGGGGAPLSGTGSGTGTGTGTTTPATTTPTTTTPAAAASVAVSLYNAAGTVVTSIGVDGGYTLRARVTDSSGAVVANRLVTFTVSNAALAVLTSTTALTDGSGIAQVGVSPVSVIAVGAVTATATATVGTAAVVGAYDFSVSTPALTLSPVSVGSTSLGSGGNTTLEVTALVGGAASVNVPVNVVFTTSCGRINSSPLNASVTTNGLGAAVATYTAVSADGTLCSGAATITASSSGTTARTTTILVAAPTANALTFVSATPGQIFVAGSGATEQSVAVFRVLSSGTPLPGTSVTFSLLTNPGGAGLGARASTVPVVVTSDSSGNASVTVFSGTIPGPVRVKAALTSDATVFAETQNLTIASGPPSQRFMSLSVSTSNIEGAEMDGTATTLTARLADRQGNPVVDGTVVNFTSEGGQVAGSCATARVNNLSQCSVNFQSQNPRPADGRVSVLAFTEGTKDYIDVNANNIFDPGTDILLPTAGGGIGDAYRDDNENKVFDIGEFIVQRGVSGAACASSGWPFPSTTNCNTSLATTVRQQAVILFSSTEAVLDQIIRTTSKINFTVRSKSHPLLPMPAGTIITGASPIPSCLVASISGTPVINQAAGADTPNEDLATTARLDLTGCVSGNVVNVTVTSPSGRGSQFAITLP